jgi:hypothetical protein
MNDPRQDAPAYAPGYPKIPNVPHERQEIDLDALLAFMPIGEPITEPTLRAQKLFKGLRGDEQLQWTVSFTLPALFARVRNLEAQVLSHQAQDEHYQREINVLVSQRNAVFQTDRRQGAYRLQIRETGTVEDRNCFGLPTVIHVQSYVPRSGHFHITGGDETVYEGKYVLLQNHQGQKAMTYAALAEEAVKSLTPFLPGPFTEREDPTLIAEQAVTALKNRQLLLQERAQFEKDAQAIETLIVKIQHKLDLVKNKKCPGGNLNEAQTLMHSLLDRFVELRGEDPATIDRDV